MSRSLLLVDDDPKSLRLLEFSLKRAGFEVATATNGLDALSKLDVAKPEVIVSDTAMPELDGFGLCSSLRDDPRFAALPFLFLVREASVEDRLRAVELGADDFVPRPVSGQEVATRVRLLLARRDCELLQRSAGDAPLKGNLEDVGVTDLALSLAAGKRSGVLLLSRGKARAQIAVRGGRIIDAQCRSALGESAVFRLLLWEHGVFLFEPGEVSHLERIQVGTHALIQEGVRRAQEWDALRRRLPPLESVLEVNYPEFAARLADIPDEINGVLRLFDTHRSLLQVVEDAPFDDLTALDVVTRLYAERVVCELSSGKPSPLSKGVEDWLATGVREDEGSEFEDYETETENGFVSTEPSARPRADAVDAGADASRVPTERPADPAPQSAVAKKAEVPSGRYFAAGPRGGTGERGVYDTQPMRFHEPRPPPGDQRAEAPRRVGDAADTERLPAGVPAPTMPDLVAFRQAAAPGEPDDRPLGTEAAHPTESGDRAAAPSPLGLSRDAGSAPTDEPAEPVQTRPAPDTGTAEAVFDAAAAPPESEESDDRGAEPSADDGGRDPTDALARALARARATSGAPEPSRRRTTTTTVTEAPDEESPPAAPVPEDTAAAPRRAETASHSPASTGSAAILDEEDHAWYDTEPSEQAGGYGEADVGFEQTHSRPNRRLWLWVGGGALVAATVLIVIYALSKAPVRPPSGPLSPTPAALDSRVPSRGLPPVTPASGAKAPPGGVPGGRGVAGAAAAGGAMLPAVAAAAPETKSPEENAGNRIEKAPTVSAPVEALPAPEIERPARGVQGADLGDPPVAPKQTQPPKRSEPNEPRIASRPKAPVGRIARSRRSRFAPRVARVSAGAAPARAAKVRRLLRRATRLLRRRRYTAALRTFRQAAQLDPQSGPAHYGMGSALFESGKEIAALPHLQRAARMQPRRAAIHIRLGSVYQARGDALRAKRSYRTYLRLAPRGKHADEVRAVLKSL